MSNMTDLLALITPEKVAEQQEHLNAILPDDTRRQLPEVLAEVRQVIEAAIPNQYRIVADDWNNAESQAQAMANEWSAITNVTGLDGNLAPAYSGMDGLKSTARELLGRLRPHVYADPDTMGRALVDARRLMDDATTVHEKVVETEARADAALLAAQATAAKQAENSLLKDFGGKASDHKSAARNWLWVTGVMSVVLAGVGWYLLTQVDPGKDDTTATIREVSLKVAILAVLAFGVAFASKNYRANRHMQISYEMRGSIVNTAMALRESVEDGRTRDAIIEAMVVTVFSVADSGFGSDGGTPTDPTITGALLSLSRQSSGPS